MIDPNSPLNYVRDNQRQAEIRELYHKVSRLEQFVNTNVAVEAEAPTPIVLSPVVNYLDNSDFKLSVKDYSTTTTIGQERVFTRTAADEFTSVAHGLLNGDLVFLTTTGTLPAGLSTTTKYYIVQKTSDTFKLSLSIGGAAETTTDAGTGTHKVGINPCTILDKWYKSTNLNYTQHDYTSTTPSANKITETSTGVKWDPYRNVLILDGGDRIATPLFDKYASPGNTLYFRMQAYHTPIYLSVIEYSGDTLKGYYSGTFPLVDNMIVSFYNNLQMIPENGYSIKPNPVGFDEALKVDVLTSGGNETIGGVTYTIFTFKLKRLTNDEYVTGMDSVTLNPNELASATRRLCTIYTRPHPETLIKVNILEDDGTGTLTLMQEGSPPNDKKTELVIGNTFDKLTGTVSIEVVGTLNVPVYTNSFNRNPQWMQVSFLVGNTPITATDIAPGTLFFDKIALSSTYGSWSPSFRDSVVAITCTRTAPGGLEPIPEGGGRGIVALPPPPDGGGTEEPYIPGIPQLPPPSRGGLF